jgi:hypothetical protein
VVADNPVLSGFGLKKSANNSTGIENRNAVTPI